MFRVRVFSGSLLLAAGLVALSGPALAASSNCGHGKPAWWNAPRVSYTYSNSNGSGYAHAATHDLSAQRRPAGPATRSYRTSSTRW
jgi:hypothetical protein